MQKETEKRGPGQKRKGQERTEKNRINENIKSKKTGSGMSGNAKRRPVKTAGPGTGSMPQDRGAAIKKDGTGRESVGGSDTRPRRKNTAVQNGNRKNGKKRTGSQISSASSVQTISAGGKNPQPNGQRENRGTKKTDQRSMIKNELWQKLQNADPQAAGKKLRAHTKQIAAALLWIVQIGIACLLAFTLVYFYGQRVSNAGDSMSPVLKNGDVVLVDRLIYNAVKPKRGDVIVFKPDGNKNAHYLIKRIVALPGETIQIIDGSIYIDGKECTEDIYAVDIKSPGIAADPIELGENEFFVIGDNHAGSDDSRMADLGNVNRKDIYGKVWFIVNFGDNFGFLKQNK